MRHCLIFIAVLLSLLVSASAAGDGEIRSLEEYTGKKVIIPSVGKSPPQAPWHIFPAIRFRLNMLNNAFSSGTSSPNMLWRI